MKTPKTQREVIDALKVKHYNQIRKLFQKQMKELQAIYEQNVTEQLEIKRQKILKKKGQDEKAEVPDRTENPIQQSLPD